MTFLKAFERYQDSQSTALVCGSVSLRYAELYRRCAALAQELRSRGVGLCSTMPEAYDIFHPKAAVHSPWVVIISSRSVNAVVAAIATWMAGGAFVLAGADTPQAHIDSMIEDTAATVVLRDGDLAAFRADTAFSPVASNDRELACAVFTSGSTGRPKGAALEHRTIREMLRWQRDYMHPETLLATAAYAPFGFIAALWDLFFPLANGLTLHILEDTLRHDLFALESYIEAHSIAYLFLPPNIAEVFTKTYQGKALQYLRVAGGRLNACGNPKGYEILYSLGMAENGGSVTFRAIRRAQSGDIPVGRPWGRTKLRLHGETGEMIVSGPSLFRGYLAMREETQRRLRDGEYYSGDLARIDGDGELVHMGRSDFVVKIRDMKVNPLQVESVLGACAGVSECCVTAQTLHGGAALIGWFAGDADEAALRAELSAGLPVHMIPAVLIPLERMPRNANGKIDRSTLVYTPPKREGGGSTGLAALFSRVLGCAAGEDDSFLALGGDSLGLMRLQAEIARVYARSIPYAALFENPTPRKTAALLQNGADFVPIPPAAPQEAYPLSGPMRQMWLLWRTGQDGGKYSLSTLCRFEGAIDKARVNAALLELTRRHSILRASFFEQDGAVFQRIGDRVAPVLSDAPRRAYDLSAPPLFGVALQENALCFWAHHIITDAMGMRVLIEDFWTLYHGGEPPPALQAHDITMWSLDRDSSAEESYWQRQFSGHGPTPPLPLDFPRPARLHEAASETLRFDEAETAELRAYAAARGATVFQLLLAAYALLLTRLCGGGSVTIGVPFSGREHPDTQRVVGMLARTLPLKLDVASMSLEEALTHTRDRFTEAWAHQNVSLERLAELHGNARTGAGNAFYDVMVNFVPLPLPLPGDSGLSPVILRGEAPGALFDLILDIQEEAEGLSVVFRYAGELFRAETVRRWAQAFSQLLRGGRPELDDARNPAPGPGAPAPAPDMTLPQAASLLTAWRAVFHTETPLLEENFFAVGGTSLLAIRLEAALFEEGWLLSAADILQHPLPADMVARMVPADEIDWEEDL